MKKIFIVVDYQHDFVDGILGIEGANKIADNIQNKIQDKIYENVIYTFDTHTPLEYMGSDEQKMFNDIHCEFKTKGWQLFNIVPNEIDAFNNTIKDLNEPFDMLNINDKEFFFCKNKFDIWTGNEVYEQWFVNKYNPNEYEFDIAGVAIEYCVNMNVLGLIERGYKVNILKDCIKAINDIDGINTLESYKDKVTII